MVVLFWYRGGGGCLSDPHPHPTPPTHPLQLELKHNNYTCLSCFGIVGGWGGSNLSPTHPLPKIVCFLLVGFFSLALSFFSSPPPPPPPPPLTLSLFNIKKYDLSVKCCENLCFTERDVCCDDMENTSSFLLLSHPQGKQHITLNSSVNVRGTHRVMQVYALL